MTSSRSPGVGRSTPVPDLVRALTGAQHFDAERLDRGPLSWLLRNGCGPLLVAACESSQAEHLEQRWPELQAARLEAQLRAGLLEEALDEVLGIAAAEGCTPLLLKGAALASTVYPEPWLRPMRDLDLLVEPEELDALEAALRDRGWKSRSHNPAEYYDEHHHSMPLFDERRRVWLELHTDLFPTRDPLATTSFFSRSAVRAERRRGHHGNHAVDRLSVEAQIAHTACHWSAEYRPLGSLIGICDLTLLTARHLDEIDWGALLDRTSEPPVRARLVPALTLLERLGLMSLPRSWSDRLQTEAKRFGPGALRLHHRIVERFYLEGRSAGRILTFNNLAAVWSGLHEPEPPAPRLPYALWMIVSPPSAPSPFAPSYIAPRLLRLLRSILPGNPSKVR